MKDAVEFIMCLLAAALISASIVWCILSAIEKEDKIRMDRLNAHLTQAQREEVMRGVER